MEEGVEAFGQTRLGERVYACDREKGQRNQDAMHISALWMLRYGCCDVESMVELLFADRFNWRFICISCFHFA